MTTDSQTPGTGCDEFIVTERRRWIEAAMPYLRRAARSSGPSASRSASALRSLRGSTAAARVAGGAAATAALPRVSFAAGGGAPSRDVLVYIMLRGGMDGLSLCVPHADPDYGWQRGSLALPGPGSSGGVTDLDGFFGLNPAASALLPAYQSGNLAFLHTAGSTDPTRSHFDAMKFIEGGVPDQSASVITSGWLGRHLASVPALNPAAALRGVAVDYTAPLTLAGAPDTLNIPDLSDFAFGGYQGTQLARQDALGGMYSTEQQPVRGAARATLDTVDVLAAIDFENYVPAGGAIYPDTEFGDRLKASAALIKADVGVEAIEVDRGGWDHHDNMGPINGELADKLAELSQALAAFRTDLASLMSNVTLVAMSEFGRRVDANGSGGTDHGRGGCMLVMGGNVNGGQVLRDWIGLDPANLDDKALPVRIDYRDVLIEVLSKRLGNTTAASLFPNHPVITDWGVVN